MENLKERIMRTKPSIDNSQQVYMLGDSSIESCPPLHKSPFQWMDTDSLAWRAIVDYVLAHQDDIINNINDFETLKPVLDHFNRYC